MSDRVTRWLEELGLSKYIEVFVDNDIDFRALPELTDRDLKDLGVSLGHRRVLQKAIAAFGEIVVLTVGEGGKVKYDDV